MSYKASFKSLCAAALIAFSTLALPGCDNSAGRIRRSNNQNNDNENVAGNYGNNNADNGNGGVFNILPEPGTAAAGNHPEETNANIGSSGVQPGTATVEWNGKAYNAAASYQDTNSDFSIKATFGVRHITMTVNKTNVREGSMLELKKGDFISNNKTGSVFFVNFPTTNGIVNSNETRLTTMYDLSYFKDLTLKVEKYDPSGITQFVCSASVDMGTYGTNTFNIRAAVEVGSSQSYGGGNNGGSAGGGNSIVYGNGKCSYCNGLGTCPVCGGLRDIYVPSLTGKPGTTVKCSSCDGSGRCEWCHGTGKG